MNTAEIIAGEVCGTAAFLGLAIGYPWLVLHYAHLGVLKLGKPAQRNGTAPKAEIANSAGGAVDEAASPAVPKPTMREVA
jgi:hypothetical protein